MILVSNDDGIDAAGIKALSEALASLDRVIVVAPDRERSAASHALTLHHPLRYTEVGPGRFMVDGTPTDCVHLAVNGLLDERPQLLVSGINRGGNLGDDITYSGTVAAAMEGTLLKVPSIAISLDGFERFDYQDAAHFAVRIARKVIQRGLPPDHLLNVNVPERHNGVPRGVMITRQGKRFYGEPVVEKLDPRGRKYYWIGAEGDQHPQPEKGTDLWAVQNGYISVTPLWLDLTGQELLGELESWEL
ncbi:MAG: 5'/3'-nucleotidase SurE [Candidatus Alcyoniella australis]|nr:5'/3'-nucleotidase SurE [Candidatus Alcyoniella australis]